MSSEQLCNLAVTNIKREQFDVKLEALGKEKWSMTKISDHVTVNDTVDKRII